MNLSEWIIGTNQILRSAEQNLPPEYVNQLRIFQQTLMVNHLQSGFLANNRLPVFETPEYASWWKKGEENVEDLREPEGSPWRNRPRYLEDKEYSPEFWQQVERGGNTEPSLSKAWAPPPYDPDRVKDWNAKPDNPPPPKDWDAKRPELAKKDWDKFTANPPSRYMPTTEEIIDNRKVWDNTAERIGVVKFD